LLQNGELSVMLGRKLGFSFIEEHLIIPEYHLFLLAFYSRNYSFFKLIIRFLVLKGDAKK